MFRRFLGRGARRVQFVHQECRPGLQRNQANAFRFEDFELQNYQVYLHIPAPVAV